MNTILYVDNIQRKKNGLVGIMFAVAVNKMHTTTGLSV